MSETRGFQHHGPKAARIEAILEAVERSLAEGTYLANSPQFVVTARA